MADGYRTRDLALSEAQEAVHVERFYKHPVDSFYAGMRHAEGVIQRLREGAPSALAVEHANLQHEVALLREVLVFADGRSVGGGYRLADLYAADSEKQGVLERAGCHPRTSANDDAPAPDRELPNDR